MTLLINSLSSAQIVNFFSSLCPIVLKVLLTPRTQRQVDYEELRYTWEKNYEDRAPLTPYHHAFHRKNAFC